MKSYKTLIEILQGQQREQNKTFERKILVTREKHTLNNLTEGNRKVFSLSLFK